MHIHQCIHIFYTYDRKIRPKKPFLHGLSNMNQNEREKLFQLERKHILTSITVLCVHVCVKHTEQRVQIREHVERGWLAGWQWQVRDGAVSFCWRTRGCLRMVGDSASHEPRLLATLLSPVNPAPCNSIPPAFTIFFFSFLLLPHARVSSYCLVFLFPLTTFVLLLLHHPSTLVFDGFLEMTNLS